MANINIDTNFEFVLKELDFSLGESSLPEIVFVKNVPQNLHPKHYIYLEFAEILEADAVYFKYYSDDRHCIPQVYFYDNQNGKFDKNRIAEIHRNVYSSSQVPLIVFIDKLSITLFDARKPVSVTPDGESISNDNCKIEQSYLILEELPILYKYFNAKKLNSSEFWESNEASEHFRKNTSAYEELVNSLSIIRNDFQLVFQKLEEHFVNKTEAIQFADDILFKCILIKYLEENGSEYACKFYNDNGIICRNFDEILKSNRLIDLLEKLEIHFNGNVFLIDDDKKKILNRLNLNDLALCLEGKYGSNRTGYFWEMYSFKHIPIELISNFYEEFIPKDKENSGTVYTPSYLVNLLIDECLPLSEKEEHLNFNLRLADVSCGSGIFITTAFKRLVQRSRIKKWIDDGRPKFLPTPSLEEVKKILSDNIFGIDLHPTSVKLTKFSLQLALCQLVPQKELWTWNEDRVFKDLEDKNIFNKDFFDFLIENKDFHSSLDLVIGNPPFISLKEDKDNKEYSKITSKLKEKLGFQFSVKIPDNQLALMFLEASNLLLKEKGSLCYIQKSTSLLYNSGAKPFRNSLFNQFHVHQIIDFTLLKNDLFKSKIKTLLDERGRILFDKNGKPKKSKSTSVESCAIFYKKEKVEDYDTNHIISRLLKNTKDGLSFEFDYYDFNEISKNQVLEDDTIWRCNLLGGSRLNHLIRKLNQSNHLQTTFKNYIKYNLEITSDFYGEGYMRGDGSEVSDLITSNLNLTAKNFESKKYRLVEVENSQRFIRTRNEKVLFKTPLILIKEEIKNGEFLIIFIDDSKYNYVPFDSRIVGVSLQNKKKYNPEVIFSILNKNKKINVLKTLATCSQFFLGSSSVIQKADIDNWTIPLDGDEIKLSFAEKIVMNDVLDYNYPSWYEGENAKANKPIESINILKEFADIFNQSFNSIYKKENLEQKLCKIFEGSTFYALEFEYSDNQILEPENVGLVESEQQINELIKYIYERNKVINRVLKLYSPNKITLVKPKNLRYWLKSIALRDADDVFDDIIDNGLK